MVGVTVEVSNATDRFEVAARASSIERAVHMVAELYPHCLVRVSFPIDPAAFFMKEPQSLDRSIEEKQERLAA